MQYKILIIIFMFLFYGCNSEKNNLGIDNTNSHIFTSLKLNNQEHQTPTENYPIVIEQTQNITRPEFITDVQTHYSVDILEALSDEEFRRTEPMLSFMVEGVPWKKSEVNTVVIEINLSE